MHKKRFSPRFLIQVAYTALTNGYAAGFAHGKIYQGPMKQVCLPGLNCYSCPGALGACPIGAMQAVLSGSNHHFSFYVLGFLLAVGALCGRLVCGFLCPFGLVQDLLHKIPLPKKMKIRRIPGEKKIGFLRYAVLLVLVILLPMLAVNAIGQGDPWFCKYLCPSGTLMGGVPLVLISDQGEEEKTETVQNTQALKPIQKAGLATLGGAGTQPKENSLSLTAQYRDAAGGLFHWKLTVLGLILIFSMVYYRPFCRFLCPLGAIYGLINPISMYRYRVIKERCDRCGACKRACKLGIDPLKQPNSPDCIRCGACIRACPKKALLPSIRLGFEKRKQKTQGCGGHCAGCSGCKQKEK